MNSNLKETGEVNVPETPLINPESKTSEEILRARENYDPRQCVERLINGLKFVDKHVIGRERLLVQTLYALLSREHQLIYSRAGIAKSLYAGEIFSLFDGARVFSMQMTKGTPEEGVVGAIDINQLKNGNIIHNTEGTIVDARFAFLDEIFDANDVVLRSLLGVLNEREFKKGKQYQKASLHTAIATTNYVRATDITEAVVDRFAFRAYLLPDEDPYTLLRIDRAYEKDGGKVALHSEKTTIPFDYVEYLADIVDGTVSGKEIKARAHILFLKNAIVSEFVKQLNIERKKKNQSELYVSPRTLAKTRDVLNASALLGNRSELITQDLAELRYMICTVGHIENQEKYFDEAFQAITNGLSKQDLETVDLLMEAHSLLEAVIAKKEEGIEISPTFWDRVKILFRLISLSDLTYRKVQDSVNSVPTSHPLVNDLKQSLLRRVEHQMVCDKAGANPSTCLLF